MGRLAQVTDSQQPNLRARARTVRAPTWLTRIMATTEPLAGSYSRMSGTLVPQASRGGPVGAHAKPNAAGTCGQRKERRGPASRASIRPLLPPPPLQQHMTTAV